MRTIIPGHATATIAYIDLDKHLRLLVVCRVDSRCRPRPYQRIDTKRDTRPLHQGPDPVVLVPPENRVGNAHIVEIVIHEDLSLTDFSDRDALRADPPLMPCDGDRFVGFDMGP